MSSFSTTQLKSVDDSFRTGSRNGSSHLRSPSPYNTLRNGSPSSFASDGTSSADGATGNSSSSGGGWALVSGHDDYKVDGTDISGLADRFEKSRVHGTSEYIINHHHQRETWMVPFLGFSLSLSLMLYFYLFITTNIKANRFLYFNAFK